MCFSNFNSSFEIVRIMFQFEVTGPGLLKAPRSSTCGKDKRVCSKVSEEEEEEAKTRAENEIYGMPMMILM